MQDLWQRNYVHWNCEYILLFRYLINEIKNFQLMPIILVRIADRIYSISIVFKYLRYPVYYLSHLGITCYYRTLQTQIPNSDGV